MKLSEFKNHLLSADPLIFVQSNGNVVPLHFHITEAGLVNKQFIDCGGVVRSEKNISLQLWVAHDYDHRMNSAKVLSIIEKFEGTFGTSDEELEIEYQMDTIGKYGLTFDGRRFVLIPKHTNCLAPNACGIPPEKQKVSLAALQNNCCSPEGNCC